MAANLELSLAYAGTTLYYRAAGRGVSVLGYVTL